MGMEWDVILSLIFFAFTAGAIDAAVGGGGLIQIPGIMSTFPSMHRLQRLLVQIKFHRFLVLHRRLIRLQKE